MRRAWKWLALFAVWSLPGVLAAAATVLLFPLSASVRANVGLFLAASITSWWFWAFVTPVIAWAVRKYPLATHSIKSFIAKHASVAVLLSLGYVVWYSWVAWVTRPASLPNEDFLRIVRGYVSSRFAVGLIVYATIAAVLVAMAERAGRREREMQAERLRADLARAQLQSLQVQLQPHFLFNTLHAISMLITEDPAAGTRMVGRLGDLLRSTLSLAATPELALREELELLDRYLEIEAARFGDRLRVSREIDATLLDEKVPSLLLQPLVENAIRYAVAPRIEGGAVSIRARRSGEKWSVTVADDGPGFPAQAGSGVGLSTTRERLTLRYGDRAALRRVANDGGGAAVIVELPLSNSS